MRRRRRFCSHKSWQDRRYVSGLFAAVATTTLNAAPHCSCIADTNVGVRAAAVDNSCSRWTTLSVTVATGSAVTIHRNSPQLRRCKFC